MFDKGCVSFALLTELAQRGAFFVTRMKDHDRVRVHAARPVRPGSGVCAPRVRLLPARGQALETVQILGQAARREGLPLLRRATDVDAESARRYVFSPTTSGSRRAPIADLYKERWQIELFIKSLSRTSGSPASSERRPTPS